MQQHHPSILKIILNACGLGITLSLYFTMLFAQEIIPLNQVRSTDSLANAIITGEVIGYAIYLSSLGLRKKFTHALSKTFSWSALYLVTGTACGVISILTLTTILLTGHNLAIELAAGLLFGIGYAFLLMMWLKRIFSFPHKETLITHMVAWILAALFFLALTSLPGSWTLVAIPLALFGINIPLLCTVLRNQSFDANLSWTPENSSTSSSNQPVLERNSLWTHELFASSIGIGAIAFVYGVAGAAFIHATPMEHPAVMSRLIHAASMIVASILVYCYLSFQKNSPRLIVYIRRTASVAISLMVVLPFTDLWYLDFFNLAAVILFRIMTVLVFAYCLLLPPDRFTLHTPILLGFIGIGTVSGVMVGAAVLATQQDATQAIFVLTIACLYLIYLSRSLEARSLFKPGAPSEQNPTEHIEEILCSRTSLTAREREICLLILKGRSATYIADELVLSVNTIKSYIKSIYAKTNVHSKQELIDLVESWKAPQSE